ncbi:hypothetical protein [Pseudoduganella sp. OTU4001]|uniref:hypothetical protein n=1 Tax=Pseudoduganella sp. OTU4001 TaxID=3043854 RepID=UPI00313C71EF
MSNSTDPLAAALEAAVISQRKLEEELGRLKVDIVRLQTKVDYLASKEKLDFSTFDLDFYRFAAVLIVVVFLVALCDH